MKHMLRLTDYSIDELTKIFNIADEITLGNYKDILKDKTVVMFFPASSIRTRVTFEKGINLLGGQTILFPTETLDKKEAIQDVIGYLNNWADLIIVRHKNIALLEEIARYSKVPVINAMTDVNHPCEILSDLYSLSKIRSDYLQAKYLFCGTDGNIGRAWKEASDVFGFSLEQCCKADYEIPDVKAYEDINDAIIGKDIVCTDSLPEGYSTKYKNVQVTKTVMAKANEGALLNPCPPFYRGEEVSANVIDSDYFVGYEFKKSLLNVQQAIMVYCLKF